MIPRPYLATDLSEWLRMRLALWPELAHESHPEDDASQWLTRTDGIVLVVERPGNTALAGFIEVGERAFADGCDTSPVAYLEGWYVDPDLRRRGIGTALLKAAMQWAADHGYREMASDALLENVDSQRAHEAGGFVEVERAVRYKRAL